MKRTTTKKTMRKDAISEDVNIGIHQETGRDKMQLRKFQTWIRKMITNESDKDRNKVMSVTWRLKAQEQEDENQETKQKQGR